MSEYSELFKDPRWQKLRLKILEANNWECQNCGSKDKTLNVHHKYYKKNSMPWEYKNHELLCLCKDCHKEYHKLLAIFKNIGLYLSLGSIYRLLGYYECIEKENMVDKIDMSDVKPINYEHAQGIADYFKEKTETIISLVKNSE